jgi:hypothetical protein
MTGQEAMQALQQEKIATTLFDRNMERDQAGYDNNTALTRLRAGLSLQAQKTMAELNDKIGDGNAEVRGKQSENLLRLKFELQALADTKLTAAQEADVDAALKRIEIQQGQLEVAQDQEARLGTASEASNALTKAQTDGQEIENASDQIALDELKNPPDDPASDITFDSFNIKQAAAGDIGGAFKGFFNTGAGMLGTGPVSPAQTGAIRQMNTINQAIRGPLSKQLSSLGSKFALDLTGEVLPSKFDSDFVMAGKIENLVTQTLPAALSAAKTILQDKKGNTKTAVTSAQSIEATVPAIIEALKKTLAGSGFGEQTSQAQQDADAYLSGKLPAGVTPEDAAIANATAPTQSSIGAADDLID